MVEWSDALWWYLQVVPCKYVKNIFTDHRSGATLEQDAVLLGGSTAAGEHVLSRSALSAVPQTGATIPSSVGT